MDAVAVQNWATKAMATTSPRAPITAHLDDLLGNEIGADAFDLAARAFVILVDCMQGHLNTLMPVLVLPLGSTPTLSTEVPSWPELASFCYEEPPSLAVLHTCASTLVDRAEEYVRFLAVPEAILDPPEGKCLAYYRCFRPTLSIENNWEYERCVYLKAVSKDHVL